MPTASSPLAERLHFGDPLGVFCTLTGCSARGCHTMQQGSITRLIRDRGFGFVRTETGSEVFLHHSALPGGVFDTLAEGQQVEFEIVMDPRGRGERASNVRILN